MEIIRGRMSLNIGLIELSERLADYSQISLDLGTGDGRFVRCLAEKYKDRFFIGVDACRENLRANSLRKLSNALFVIANAQTLPFELNGQVSHIIINFPWGSLLESLLNNDTCLFNGLLAISRSGAAIEIHLNGEALSTAGWTLESGADRIDHILNNAGWKTKSCSRMDAQALRSLPTTWAKRLAFGRDPRAIQLSFQRE